MAVSVVMHFTDDRDARKVYDDVVDEMGIRNNPPPGSRYHWCAPLPEGMLICDVWDSRETFERFAQDKIGPLTAKQGLAPPSIEIGQATDIVASKTPSRTGVGVVLELNGDPKSLLAMVSRASGEMRVHENPPDGLIYHWAMERPGGIRVIDHWRSRADFDVFVETKLKAVIRQLGMPTPQIEFFEIYNTIAAPVTTPV